MQNKPSPTDLPEQNSFESTDRRESVVADGANGANGRGTC